MFVSECDRLWVPATDWLYLHSADTTRLGMLDDSVAVCTALINIHCNEYVSGEDKQEKYLSANRKRHIHRGVGFMCLWCHGPTTAPNRKQPMWLFYRDLSSESSLQVSKVLCRFHKVWTFHPNVIFREVIYHIVQATCCMKYSDPQKYRSDTKDLSGVTPVPVIWPCIS